MCVWKEAGLELGDLEASLLSREEYYMQWIWTIISQVPFKSYF